MWEYKKPWNFQGACRPQIASGIRSLHLHAAPKRRYQFSLKIIFAPPASSRDGSATTHKILQIAILCNMSHDHCHSFYENLLFATLKSAVYEHISTLGRDFVSSPISCFTALALSQCLAVRSKYSLKLENKDVFITSWTIYKIKNLF